MAAHFIVVGKYNTFVIIVRLDCCRYAHMCTIAQTYTSINRQHPWVKFVKYHEGKGNIGAQGITFGGSPPAMHLPFRYTLYYFKK